MMKIGDRKLARVHFGDTLPRDMVGTVVYIHPDRRFYVLEFEFERFTCREAYYFPGRGGPDT